MKTITGSLICICTTQEDYDEILAMWQIHPRLVVTEDQQNLTVTATYSDSG